MAKHEQQMQLIAPDPDAHAEEMIDLVCKVFSHNGYYPFRDRCRGGYILGGANYDWKASRIGILDGRIVTHWGAWDLAMRVGAAAIRVVGIGAVATHGDYRQRGLMAETAKAGMEAMAPLGYDATLLYGIHDFYHRFGYVRAWNATTYTVATPHLPSEAPERGTRKFAVKHREDLAALYNRENRVRTGTAVRPTFRGVPFPNHSLEGLLWTDAGGKVAGWVVNKGSEIVDHAGDVEQVLRVVHRLARHNGWGEVTFSDLHYASDLCRRLRRGNCTAKVNYVRSGGAMMHVVNLRQTLEHVAPELSRRVKASHLDDWSGTLLVSDERERVGLRIDGGTVCVTDPVRTKHTLAAGHGVAQLVLGTDDPHEVLEANSMRPTGDGWALTEVLFPHQHPTLGTLDRM